MEMVEEKVRTFLISELGWAGERDRLTNDLSLIDAKVLDSLAIQQMVAFLEDEFGIEVRDEEVLPSNFETIGAIARLVDSKRAA
jgi:acyl carrier protein